MGLFDKLGQKMVPQLGDIEREMARDAGAPPELLRRIAQTDPQLWDALLENPRCPADVRSYIDQQRST